MNFSVVLIAKNEEKTLPRLLESLSEFKGKGGEIILLDTGSTDKTVKVAKEAGCKVTEVGTRFITKIDKKRAERINKKFVVKGEEPIVKDGDRLFDYAAARNFAATLAGNDMVAMPDCDEAYTKLDLGRISELIEGGVTQFEYNFVYSHDELGNEAVKFVHSKFYDRTKLKWVGIVHEVLQGDAKREYLDEDVIKLEHWQNEETNRSGYLVGLALDCYENPGNDRNSHYLAREMFWKGRPLSAIREFERHVAMKKWPAERAESFILMGRCYESIGNDEKAIDCWHRGHQADPNRRASMMALADYFYRYHNATQTNFYAEAALLIPPAPIYCDDHADFRERPHEMLYWAKSTLGLDGAEYHYDKALEYAPNCEKYLGDWKYVKPAPLVSIVVPTLGRTEKLERLLNMIQEEANYPNYEVIVVHDGEERKGSELASTVLVNKERQGVPKSVKLAVQASSGPLVMYLGNDCIPEPNFLVKAVKAMHESFPEMDGLIGLNDGYWKGEMATHWLASKALLPNLDGEFFNTQYHHCGCDNELTERCRVMGKYVWAEDARVYHDHPIQDGFKELDEVYRIAYDDKRSEADKKLLRKRAEKYGWDIPEFYSRPLNN